jgi:hypothetical protein
MIYNIHQRVISPGEKTRSTHDQKVRTMRRGGLKCSVEKGEEEKKE